MRGVTQLRSVVLRANFQIAIDLFMFIMCLGFPPSLDLKLCVRFVLGNLQDGVQVVFSLPFTSDSLTCIE
jgi:hypothetical protein